MKLISSGRTNVGMKRPHNEDSLRICREYDLFIVADGMGGHASGEVASQMAVETVSEFFRSTAEDEETTWPFKMEHDRDYEENRVVVGIKLANRRIFESAGRDAKLKGMGTTIVALYCHQSKCFIAHVGDSRIYRYRESALEQMTTDHSLLNDYIKMRQMTPEEIESFPHKNVIVRALGMKDSVQVDVRQEDLQQGDVFLLCSDGLSGMVNDARMAEILAAEPDLEQACEKLIDEANANGGNDNVTVVLVRVEEP